MGTYVFKLPDIGEGIAEAEIVAWHVKVGDRVEEDGRLADMMTDKATVEMESPVAGIVTQVAGEVGDVVAIGGPLVVIETEGHDEADFGATSTPSKASTRVAPKSEVLVPPEREIKATQAPESIPAPTQPEPAEVSAPNAAKVFASPAVRARARDHGRPKATSLARNT